MSTDTSKPSKKSRKDQDQAAADTGPADSAPTLTTVVDGKVVGFTPMTVEGDWKIDERRTRLVPSEGDADETDADEGEIVTDTALARVERWYPSLSLDGRTRKTISDYFANTQFWRASGEEISDDMVEDIGHRLRAGGIVLLIDAICLGRAFSARANDPEGRARLLTLGYSERRIREFATIADALDGRIPGVNFGNRVLPNGCGLPPAEWLENEIKIDGALLLVRKMKANSPKSTTPTTKESEPADVIEGETEGDGEGEAESDVMTPDPAVLESTETLKKSFTRVVKTLKKAPIYSGLIKDDIRDMLSAVVNGSDDPSFMLDHLSDIIKRIRRDRTKATNGTGAKS